MRYLMLTSSLALLPILAHASAPVAKVPVAAFVADDQYSLPRMSPDGKHLAVTVRTPVGKRLVPMISFYTLPDLKLKSTVRLKAFEVPSNYYWASNTRLVLEKAQEFGSREVPWETGEVMAMELDGTKQEYLFGYNMFAYATRNRHDDDHAYGYVSNIPEPLNNRILLTSQPWRLERSVLLEIDTLTGTRKERANLPLAHMRFVSQRDGTPRFAYGTRVDDTFVLMRSDANNTAWREVAADRVGVILRPIAFSNDSSSFLAWHSANGGPSKLVMEASASGERRTVAEDTQGNLAVMFGSTSDLPFAAVNQVGKPRVTYFDPKEPDAQLHKALAAQFPDSVVRFINFTADGNKVLFSVRSDRDPGAYYIFDRKSGNADMLMLAMEQIPPELMAERQPISFKARDGLQLHGYLTMPRVPADAKAPLVLLPHGGPHGPSDGWYFHSEAQFLANRGYAVLQVNFRGSGGRGPAFEESGYRQWGGKILDDLVDGVQWASARPDIDASRKCVYGASFGGYAALMLAAREPDLFKCAIGYAGVYDLAALHKEERPRISRRSATVLRNFIGTDAAELQRFSPVAQAARIKAPVLLIHGGKDEVAQKEHAFRMRDALTSAGKAPEWMYVDYEGHGFYDIENATAVYEKLEAFLGRHIGKP